jgi:hypothetical protein
VEEESGMRVTVTATTTTTTATKTVFRISMGYSLSISFATRWAERRQDSMPLLMLSA